MPVDMKEEQHQAIMHPLTLGREQGRQRKGQADRETLPYYKYNPRRPTHTSTLLFTAVVLLRPHPEGK